MDLEERLKLDSIFTLTMIIMLISIIMAIFSSFARLDFTTIIIATILILVILSIFVIVYLSSKETIAENEEALIKEIATKKYDKDTKKKFSEEMVDLFRKDIEDIGLKDSYKEGAKIAADIFEITHHREAIMILGRTLEEAIDDYLALANKKHKIRLSQKRKESQYPSLHKRINFLNEKKLVGPTDYNLMMALKWDRNISSHPKSKKEIENMLKRVKNMFSLGLNSIKVIQNKIEELKKK